MVRAAWPTRVPVPAVTTRNRRARRAIFRLQASLLSDFGVSVRRPTFRPVAQRQRHLGETRKRGDSPTAQLANLKLQNSGDERKMIISPPAIVAPRPPLTDVAQLDRIRVCR